MWFLYNLIKEIYMENCIFCKIASHIIPSSVVYEDDDVIAFLDISQTTEGHTLVIPKTHYDNFLTVPKDVMNKVMNVAQRIGQILINNFGAKGINILSNCYEAAGQTVMHFHVHVIPRYISADGLTIEMHQNEDLENINLPVLASEIKKLF
jgi:histidine triad (HIT) family protein